MLFLPACPSHDITESFLSKHSPVEDYLKLLRYSIIVTKLDLFWILEKLRLLSCIFKAKTVSWLQLGFFRDKEEKIRGRCTCHLCRRTPCCQPIAIGYANLFTR